MSWSTVARLARYGVAGSLSAGTHFGATALLVELTGLRPSIATNVGFALSVIVSYVLQRAWVFRSPRRHRQAFPRFVTVVAISGVVNLTTMVVGTDLLDFPYLIVQGVAVAVIPLINYSLNSTWTFAPPPPER
jgi:putative flippase GtrA